MASKKKKTASPSTKDVKLNDEEHTLMKACSEQAVKSLGNQIAKIFELQEVYSRMDKINLTLAKGKKIPSNQITILKELIAGQSVKACESILRKMIRAGY